MQSIKYVQNGKGQRVAEEVPNTQRFTLRNSVGDVTDTGLGFQIAYDTLTYIKKDVVTQKFYDVDEGLATYVPMPVGEGAFSQSILTNLDYLNSGDFESGIINTGSSNDRLAQSDASVSSKTVDVANWAKGIGYSVFDIEQALMANNWDAIAAKERARKKGWDLGIQALTFLGSKTNPTSFPGLLTSSEINVNTLLIQQPISTMNAADFATFVAGLIKAYWINSKKTAKPDRFLIPYEDFYGLQTFVPNVIGTGEGNYPVSRLDYLEKAFKAASKNPNFKILPLAYCDADTNKDWGIDKNLYLLYRFDADSVRMDIPVDYTVTQANTLNNFQFQSAAYGSFTGVHFYRPLEGLLFEYTPGS